MIYVDTSALVKLVVPERETEALRAWMRARVVEPFFSSQLTRVELLRTVTRAAPSRTQRARDVLSGVALVRIDDEIVQTAEDLPPAVLRSLDAIHLATAHSLKSQVSAFVTYDVRLGDAARALDLPAIAPE